MSSPSGPYDDEEDFEPRPLADALEDWREATYEATRALIRHIPPPIQETEARGVIRRLSACLSEAIERLDPTTDED